MMSQLSSLKQFNSSILSNSIVQFEAIQLFNLKEKHIMELDMICTTR